MGRQRGLRSCNASNGLVVGLPLIEGDNSLLNTVLKDVEAVPVEAMHGVATISHHHVHQDEVYVGAQNG